MTRAEQGRTRATPRPPTNADYETLFSMTATPTLEVDDRTTIIAVNPAGCRLFGHSREQLVGLRLDEVLGADVSEALGTDRSQDVLGATDEGPTALRVRSARRELAGPSPATHIVQLIRREGRAALDADRRGEASRLSMLDDVSHNLGTPLAIVSGYAETLAERWEQLSPAEVASATAAIRRHATRSVEELHALQARIRLTGSGAGTVPSAVLLAWLRRMLQGPLAAGSTVLVGDAVDHDVTIDVTVTRQVLLNVCRLLLSTEPAPDTISVRIRRADRGTEFRVTAEPYAPIPAEYDDTIAATRAMITKAAGRFTEPEDDTHDYVVWLPDTAHHDGRSVAQRIPVGVIEDDPDTAALIRASLHSSSAVFDLVVDERTFRAGLHAVAEERPRILLLDQALPDRLGTDGIQDLHAASPDTIIVVLSAHERDRWELEDQVSGEAVWLHKGRVLADLGRELIAVLARSG